MQTFCVRQSGECFIRCRGNSECQSFGIGVVDECFGQLQCRLYSQRLVEISDLTNDTKYTYYILVSYNALHFPIILTYSDFEFDYLANLTKQIQGPVWTMNLLCTKPNQQVRQLI